MKSIGILFIAIGIIMIAYTGFTYTTTEKVVDLGPVQIDKKENHPISWSPIIGGVLVVAGVAVILIDKKVKK